MRYYHCTRRFIGFSRNNQLSVVIEIYLLQQVVVYLKTAMSVNLSKTHAIRDGELFEKQVSYFLDRITLAQTDHQYSLFKKSDLEGCLGLIDIYEQVAPGRAG